MAGAKKWMDEFTTRAQSFQRGGAGVGVVMSGLGVSGLAAGAGIASAVAAFRDLANRAVDLKETARLTGLTTVQIQQLDRAAKDLNVDPNQLNAGLKGWAERMEEFRRHLGEVYGQLNQIDPDFARKLSFEAPLDQVKDIFHWLSKVQDPQLQRKWTELFFGTGDLSQMLANGWSGFNKALDHAVATTATMSADQIRQAQTLKNSVNDLDGAMDKFQTEAGPFIFKQLTAATKDFTELFKEIETTVEWFQKNKDHPVKAVAEAAEGAIDRQAEENKKHPEGIILDLPGVASDVIHNAIGDRRPTVQPWDNNLGLPGIDAPAAGPSALDKLRGAMERHEGPPAIVLPPGFHPSSYGGGGSSGLLHNAAYGDDDESSPRGGMGSSVLMLRDVIASGTKAGFLGAFREIQTGEPVGGAGGGGGLMNASFGGGGGGSLGGAGGGGSFGSGAGGRRAPSLRYGRQHEGSPYASADGGAVPTGAHTPLKDLIAAHETGSTGTAGYDTVYGHAERGGALAPPKPVSQMTIGDVLAYQRAMKPRAGSPAFPVGRAQWTESTLRGLTRGMDPNTIFSPDVQEKLFDRSIAGRAGQGVAGLRSEWDSLRGVDAGQIQGAADGHRKAQEAAAVAVPKGVSGKMPEWLDDKSRRELAGVNKALAGDLLAASEQTGLHFRVLQGLRTQAEAEHNAISGRGVRNSQHLFGAAADIAVQDGQGHDINDRAAYKRFADAYTAHSRAGGGEGRWLGDLPGRWGSDIAHFDQGLRYGQTHARDPYGAGGPSKGDIAQGNAEIFKGPDNPFLRGRKPAAEPRKSLLDEASKAGLGSSTVKHEGGAVIEIRGLPQGKGTRTSTSGMIEAVNLRRGPASQIG